MKTPCFPTRPAIWVRDSFFPSGWLIFRMPPCHQQLLFFYIFAFIKVWLIAQCIFIQGFVLWYVMLSPYLLLSNKVNTSVTTFRYKDPPIKSLRLLKVYLPSCIKISKLFYYTVLISLFNSLSSFHPSLPEILPCPTPCLMLLGN